jgi:hypothetical protein
LAVFDLDSTLFDLSLRVGAIVDEFIEAAARAGRLGGRERAALERLQITRHDWGLEGPLARVGLNQAADQALARELLALWRTRFFSNRYLSRDVPLEGSVDYVQKLHRAGAQILYLTGRDRPGMWDGTWASLLETGFPLDQPGTDLVLKSHAGVDDAEFKAEVLCDLAARHDRIVLFENEPVNINRVEKALPGKVHYIFVATAHSGLESLQPEVEVIHDFTLRPGSAEED